MNDYLHVKELATEARPVSLISAIREHSIVHSMYLLLNIDGQDGTAMGHTGNIHQK